MADAVRIEGLSQLSREVKKVSADLQKELKAIGKEAAELVANDARGIVPVRTGKLRNKIKSGSTNSGAYVQVGGLEYHKVIHFGWARHNISPHPFLYEARDNRYDEVLESYSKQLEAFIDKTVK